MLAGHCTKCIPDVFLRRQRLVGFEAIQYNWRPAKLSSSVHCVAGWGTTFCAERPTRHACQQAGLCINEVGYQGCRGEGGVMQIAPPQHQTTDACVK